jgi:plastocyanin
MRVVRSAAAGVAAILLSLAVVAQVHTFAAAPAVTTKTVKVIESHNRYMFSPSKITVKVGTKVIWKNTTDTGHTVTFEGSLSSFNKQLAQAKTVTHVFSKTGTYKYHCSIHPYMKGTVIVTK